MAISAINSVNFTGKKVTKKGNEYDKTNVGKYAGMGVGAAAGTGYGLKIYHDISKVLKEEGKDLNEILKGIFGEVFTSINSKLGEGIQEAGASVENGIKEATEVGVKWAKRGLKAVPVVLGSGAFLVGLGAGAIVDGIINHRRAKKADKAADKVEA